MVRDVNKKRSKLHQPRFSMSMLGHPIYFITVLKSERFAYIDGLLQRIIMLAHKPPNIRSTDRRTAIKPTVTILVIFFFLDIIHQKPRNYSFDQRASDFIDGQFDYYLDLAFEVNSYDPYLG